MARAAMAGGMIAGDTHAIARDRAWREGRVNHRAAGMQLRIVKCHGSGNDFPLVDARDVSLGEAEWAVVARALADRAGPVGGDGLLLLGAGRDGAAFSMRMLNSDGSEAETCLNGLRCVARAGFESFGLEAATVALKGSTAVVAREAALAAGVYTVRETAGPASLDAGAWPMRGYARVVGAVVPALGSLRKFTAVSIPNPHLIAFVERIDEAELVAVGMVCEAAPDWLPNRANVSFVEARDDGLFVRTHERGVGLTDACGSAMASAVYAACVTGRWRFDTQAVVRNRGGLVLARADEDGRVTLWGNATWEWTGTVEVDLPTGVASGLLVEARFADEVAAWHAVRDGAG